MKRVQLEKAVGGVALRAALAGPALRGIVLVTAFALSAGPAFTAGGAGGGGALNVPGGAGGTGPADGGNAGNGGNGTNSVSGNNASGGGGGGAGGGNGGPGGAFGGGAGGAGGAGGVAAGSGGGGGSDGTNVNTAGGGGGGGAHGFTGASINNGATIRGGAGGGGGNAAVNAQGGGGGGEGGYGAFVTSNSINNNNSAIQGGNGGAGGNPGNAIGGNGGGGNGGIGAFFGASGATLTNRGTIQGGNGGASGTGGLGLFSANGAAGAGGAGIVGTGLTITSSGIIRGGNGGSGTTGPFAHSANGAGGAGISGSNLTVTLSGAVNGGLAGDGVTQANSITLVGGANTLTLQTGFSLSGNIGVTGSLDFVQPTNVTLANIITGSGSLAKDGAGVLTLTGANTYTGITTVNGGTLSVDGSIANSDVIVNAGATLGGSGTVGNTAINGGTLAPGSVTGNALGPLTVQGNLSFTAASTYMIQVTPVNAGRTNVTGTATLGGATVSAVFLPGSSVSKQYTIVNATGGVSGTFGSLVDTNLPANFHTSLSYDAHDAFLNLALDFAISGGPLSGNQQGVGNAISNFFSSTGSIPLVFTALTPAGLTQASGEVATGSQQTTFDAMNQFMGVLLDPFIDGRGNTPASPTGATPYAEDGHASAYTSDGKRRSKSERDAYDAIYRKAPIKNTVYDPHWSVWAAGFGGSQTTDGNAALGSNTATSRVIGTAVGADYLLSPRTIMGFALAGGGTNFSVANGGTGRSDLFQAGAFVEHSVGSVYISGALAYGWQDITTNRIVTIAGVDQLQARFNANAYSGRIEAGDRFVTPWMGGLGITPYAAAQFTTFDLPAYAERVLSGANTFALAYNAKGVTDTRGELGIRTDKSFAMQDGILTLRGRVAWAHDFDPDRSIAATFQALPGASFVVNGAAQASDSALTTASAAMKWRNGWSAAATFEGEFSDVTSSYAGKGVVRYAW